MVGNIDLQNVNVSVPRRLVYILSPSFSGSTLLTMLLAQHPKIGTTGELKATAMGPMDSYSCSCGQKIVECEFWQSILEDADKKGIDFSLSNFGTHFTSSKKLWSRIMGAQVRGPLFEYSRRFFLKNLPGLSTRYKDIIERNVWLTDLVCQLQKSDLCLDGSKDPQRLGYLQRSGLWSIDVIKMYRDGRAQSNSRRKKERDPVDYKGAVREWKSTIEQMNKVCMDFPSERIHTLRYEELCENPSESLNSIFRFLDIEAIDIDWKDVDLKATEHHILGNNMRTQNRINISLDERWRKDVSQDELDYFERVAGNLSRALGYH